MISRPLDILKAIEGPCTEAMHELLKLHAWGAFLNHRPWPDTGLEMAECPRGCGSTLAIVVDAEVANAA